MSDENETESQATPSEPRATLPAPTNNTDDQAHKRDKLPLIVAGLALGIGIVGVGYAFVVQQQLQSMRINTSDFVKAVQWQETRDAQQAALKNQSALIQGLSGAIEKLQQNSVAKENVARIDQDLQSIKTTLEAVDARSREIAQRAPSETQWVVANIKHLVSVADQTLKLEHRTDTALAALTLAEAAARRSGDAKLVGLRDQLGHDIDALKSVTTTDANDIAQRLDNLSEQALQLPTEHAPTNWQTPKSEPIKPEEPGWKAKLVAIASSIGKTLRGIIEFRRDEAIGKAALSPEQQANYQQNLALQFQQAKLAYLRNNSMLFHSILAQTRAGIGRISAGDNSVVTAILADIDALQNIDITPALPSLAGSWQEIEKLTSAEVVP